jgi:hypothetical protein
MHPTLGGAYNNTKEGGQRISHEVPSKVHGRTSKRVRHTCALSSMVLGRTYNGVKHGPCFKQC